MPHKDKRQRTEYQREYQRKYRARNKEKLREYLENHPCVDCSETDIRVLDFDHINGIKKAKVTKMVVSGSYSWVSILKEIEKCEVRCANCHRKRHASGTWRCLGPVV